MVSRLPVWLRVRAGAFMSSLPKRISRSGNFDPNDGAPNEGIQRM